MITQVNRRYLVIISITLLLILALGFYQSSTSGSGESQTLLKPIFSQLEGYYEHDLLLEIRSPHPQADIIFTLDGSLPTTENSTLYTQPIPLSIQSPAVSVVRARISLPNGRLGPVQSGSYWLGVESHIPMLSIIVDLPDLWDPTKGIYANPHNRGREWERPAELTLLEKSQDASHYMGFHAPAGIRIHGCVTRNSDKKSFRLYFRNDYGLGQLSYPLFQDAAPIDRLVLYNGGQDYPENNPNWSLIRSPLMSRLAEETQVASTRSRPVLVYINGQAQGIYQIRDYIDDRYLAERYGVQAAELLSSPCYLEATPPESNAHWDHFISYLESHDLGQPDAYAYAQSQIDLYNFIDYVLLEIYAANTDWINNNVKQFRPNLTGGKWHWIFWDLDHAFGVTPWNNYDFDMLTWLYETDMPHFEQGSLPLRSFLQNPDFQARFVARAGDLLNTVLAPDHVISLINSMADELRPDIHHEMGQWSSARDWETNVEYMREFARQRPAWMRQHFLHHFDLGGTASFSFALPAAGQGAVAVNGTLIPPNWQSTYFIGSGVQFTAVPEPGYQFVGWEPADLPQTNPLTLTVGRPLNVSPRFGPAAPHTPQPNDVKITQVELTQGADLLELTVMRPGGIDLRGWRITDNDNKTATDEGSLILSEHPIFAQVPQGTRLQIVLGECTPGQEPCPADDLSNTDRHLLLYTHNENLDTSRDPWFNLTDGDNLAILAPGPSAAFDDDVGIDFAKVGNGRPIVTPHSFGILADGVTTHVPAINH